jgi:3-hydroxyisobutyrate dehydrogenase
MKIGYIGIGIMGEPMARNLLKASHDLFVFNRTISKCDSLCREGAILCKNPADVAKQVDVIFINVTDTPDVKQVLFGTDGISESARSGLTVIDNSTISPQATCEFAERLHQHGVDYLDAPVSGGDVGAKKGTLAIMVGGKKEVFDRCLPLLQVLGSKIIHLGDVGMGQTCKACNQLFCALHMLACSEGITLAKKAGLDPHKMIEVVSSGAGGSWALANLGSKIVESDLEPGFMVELLCKDLRLTMELAQQNELAMPGTALAQQFFTAALAQGLGKKGTQALSKVIEEISRAANNPASND